MKFKWPAFVNTLFPVTRPHHIYSTALVIIILIDNLKYVIIDSIFSVPGIGLSLLAQVVHSYLLTTPNVLELYLDVQTSPFYNKT